MTIMPDRDSSEGHDPQPSEADAEYLADASLPNDTFDAVAEELVDEGDVGPDLEPPDEA